MSKLRAFLARNDVTLFVLAVCIIVVGYAIVLYEVTPP